MGKPNNILGSSSKPNVLNLKKIVKVNSSVYGGEAKQNYDNNYDRIFNNAKKTKEAK